MSTLDKKDGWPWECAVALCNQANMDAWINIPVAVDDGYILQLARLLKAGLKPSLNDSVRGEAPDKIGCIERPGHPWQVTRNFSPVARCRCWSDLDTTTWLFFCLLLVHPHVINEKLLRQDCIVDGSAPLAAECKVQDQVLRLVKSFNLLALQ